VLNDPLLALFSPIDVTYFTFGILYLSLFTGLISLSRHPKSLILAMQAYSLLTLFRIAAMYVMPLDPPATMLPLADPLVELFGTGKLLTRDLFFSGHTSIMFILFLTAKDKILRMILLIGTISIALLVLVQHVHYTVDVLAALFFAWGAYSIIRKLNGETIGAS
jgi:membrane-associated phospholipid phosphatase